MTEMVFIRISAAMLPELEQQDFTFHAVRKAVEIILDQGVTQENAVAGDAHGLSQRRPAESVPACRAWDQCRHQPRQLRSWYIAMQSRRISQRRLTCRLKFREALTSTLGD